MLPTWPTLPRSLLLALTCGLAAGTFACNAVLGIEDTTLGEGGGGGDGAGLGGPGEDYACLGEEPAQPSGLIAKITIDASDATKPAKGLDNVSIKLCSKFDTQCLGGASGPLTVKTDVTGKATVPAPTPSSGFDGFLEMSAVGYKTVLWYFAKPVTEAFTLRVLMIDDATFDGLASSLGVTPDASRGHLTLDIRDCAGTPAPNVSFVSTGGDPESKAFYNLGNAFVPATATSKTDDSGQVIVFNISAPGIVTVSTTNAAGTLAAQLGMALRPGTISTVILTPNQ